MLNLPRPLDEVRRLWDEFVVRASRHMIVDRSELRASVFDNELKLYVRLLPRNHAPDVPTIVDGP